MTIKNHAMRFYFFSNFMLYVVFLSFFRELSWIIPNNTFAWILSAALSFALLIFINKRIDCIKNTGKIYTKSFAIVLIPLLIVYMFRFVFPDTSYDVINYHLINSERALRGFPFIQGDFYYLIWNNPFGDILTGIFRKLLGYRLGTVINLLVAVWLAAIIHKILYHFIKNNLFRSICTLLSIFSVLILYEINNYMVDLLALPLLFEALYLVIFADEKKKGVLLYSFIFFLFGLAMAVKLTNIVMIIPLLFIILYDLIKNRKLKMLFFSPVFFTALLLPSITFFVYMYLQTGNPVYPFYNQIFKSPFWALSHFRDISWSPVTLKQSLLWPVFRPDGKPYLQLPVTPILLPAGFILSVIILGFRKFDRRKLVDVTIIKTAIVMFISSYLWSFSSGDYRYAIFLDLLGGILLVYSAVLSMNLAKPYPLFKKLIHIETAERSRSGYGRISIIILILSAGALLLNFIFSCNHIRSNEWSKRKNIFTYPQRYFSNAGYIFRDHSLSAFLSDNDKIEIAKIDAWVSSGAFTSGFCVLLRPDIPFLEAYFLDFRGAKGKELFDITAKSLKEKRIFSLIRDPELSEENLKTTLAGLEKRGFKIKKMKTIHVPFFSKNSYYNYMFILVELTYTG